MVKAVIGGGQVRGTLSFNEIIGYVPGQGRGDAKKGMYEHVRTGNVLVVYSVNPQFVQIEARKNGRKTNKTGFTRTGMLMIDKKTGAARIVTCDDKPDGDKNWRPFPGSITLEGNPHVVPNPAAPAAVDEDYEDDEE